MGKRIYERDNMSLTVAERRNKLNDATVLELGKALYPKLNRLVRRFEYDVMTNIRMKLVEAGLFHDLPRLEGYLTVYDVKRVHRIVEAVVNKYRALVLDALLQFILEKTPIVLPDPDMEEFYGVIVKMIKHSCANYGIDEDDDECPWEDEDEDDEWPWEDDNEEEEEHSSIIN